MRFQELSHQTHFSVKSDTSENYSPSLKTDVLDVHVKRQSVNVLPKVFVLQQRYQSRTTEARGHDDLAGQILPISPQRVLAPTSRR